MGCGASAASPQRSNHNLPTNDSIKPSRHRSTTAKGGRSSLRAAQRQDIRSSLRKRREQRKVHRAELSSISHALHQRDEQAFAALRRESHSMMQQEHPDMDMEIFGDLFGGEF